jgi:pimeloyl-ACP methyl ester carboxylesterase
MNVVLIHGFCENHSVWEDFLPCLPKGNRYITPDVSRLTHCQKMDDYAKHLKQQFDAEGINEVVLVGHSMGGYIALAFAELFPEQVVGLGLFHSSSYADSEERKEKRLKTIQYIVKHGARDFVEDFLPNMFNHDYKKSKAEYIKQKIDEYSTTISEEALIAATLAMRERPDRTHILEKAEYPTLIIAGVKDKFVALDASLQQLTKMKRANALVLSEIAHAGMLESPSVCADVMKEFLKACER